MIDNLTQEELKSLLEYNPETGEFIRLVRTAKCNKIGDIAGSKDKSNYVMISLRGKYYYAHRLAFLYMTGIIPEEIDHIDLNRANNKWSNLREATRAQNSYNKKKQHNNTSGYKGVSFYKRDNTWTASIHINGRKKHLGYFPTKELAFEAYKIEAEKLHKEFVNYDTGN